MKSDASIVKNTRQILQESVSSLLAIEYEICERAATYIASYEELRAELAGVSDDSSESVPSSIASDPAVSPVPSRKFKR